MPEAEEASYLCERANKLRVIATAYSTPMSVKLLELAKDLEARARELEKPGH
jgi:hypothetical protein